MEKLRAEQIEKWFCAIPEQGFESIIGRTELKANLVHMLLGEKLDLMLFPAKPVESYILYGPPGTGKTFMINAFANELSKQIAKEEGNRKPLSFMRLGFSDAYSIYGGGTQKNIKTAFDVALEHEPCLLFIDEIDNLCVSRDGKAENVERLVTIEFLQAYANFIRSGKRVVFIGATDCPSRVDTALLDHCRLVRVPYPASADREEFFKWLLDCSRVELEAGFTTKQMADETDNYNYREMKWLWDSVLFQLEGQAVSNREIKISSTMFAKAREENPLKDKTWEWKELREFEKPFTGIGY